MFFTCIYLMIRDGGLKVKSIRCYKKNLLGGVRHNGGIERIFPYNLMVSDMVDIYTQEQLKELVAYAKKKYVTIVPEIDVPGHTRALLAAYPELGCVEDTTYEVSTVWGYDDNILCFRKETFDY